MPRNLTTFGAALALVLTMTTLAAAQSTTRPDAGPQKNEVSLVGCVEMEKDYRARTGGGRGGVLGSGVGVGNEFVLTNAKPVPKSGSTETVGTSGTSATIGDYSLTGKLESELVRYVGRQVEVVGVLETKTNDARSGEDVKDLPRLNVTVWHPVSDYCPAAK